MVTVAALGGNALIKRGEPMDVTTQRRNIETACRALAPLFNHTRLIITHGNGPQIGLLALQGEAYSDKAKRYPLDVLNAETEGMIGYLIEQELANTLGIDFPLATLLTQVEVDRNDSAFLHPTKPIGRQYNREEANTLAEQYGWNIAPDGEAYRRVVPSPLPQRIRELEVIRSLLDMGTTVICAGGGGIPTVINDEGRLEGIEAVIDKDMSSAVLARQLGAEKLLLLTDVDHVYLDWGKPTQQAIVRAHPDALAELIFAEGSMGPKVSAAIAFANRTDGVAGIGSLQNAEALYKGKSGTLVSKEFSDIVVR